MNLRRLYYFLVVAEELHFGRAAIRLRIAQPALTQQIKKLEQELGVDLLHRERGRSTELTNAGMALVQEGRRALAYAEQAADAAKRAGRGEVGFLRLGFAPSSAIDVFPRLVRTFKKRSPNVHLELVELQSEEQATGLRLGELDVGLIRPPIDDSGLRLETLTEEPLLAALPGTHPLARTTKLNLKDLAEDGFIMAPRSTAPAWFDHLLLLCKEHGFSPRIVQEVETILTRIGFVAAGLGVALLPGPATGLRRAGIAMIPLDIPPIPLLLAWRENVRSPVLKSFIASSLDATGRTL